MSPIQASASKRLRCEYKLCYFVYGVYGAERSRRNGRQPCMWHSIGCVEYAKGARLQSNFNSESATAVQHAGSLHALL
jgi:hypothetical protein